MSRWPSTACAAQDSVLTPPPISDVLSAGRAFHAALRQVPRPNFLDRRAHPWAVGDRVAWDEQDVDVIDDLSVPFSALLELRRPVKQDAAQLVHGDLTGNVPAGRSPRSPSSPSRAPRPPASGFRLPASGFWHEGSIVTKGDCRAGSSRGSGPGSRRTPRFPKALTGPTLFAACRTTPGRTPVPGDSPARAAVARTAVPRDRAARAKWFASFGCTASMQPSDRRARRRGNLALPP